MIETPSGSLSALKGALLEAGKADPAAAMSMAPSFYTSAEFLKLEEERIFRAEWICLGRVEDVAKPGDYFATELLNEPLLVMRGSDAKIRVLSNVCRHRGTTLVTGHGNMRGIVCPYHGWTYSREGQLVNAPYMEGVNNFDVSAKRLPEFATEIWKGFIYVNLDCNALPLAPRLAGIELYIGKYHLEEMLKFNGGEMVWRTNWKCVIENFIEGYHVPFTHPQSINPILPMRLNERIPGGTGYTGYRAKQVPNLPERGVFPPDVTETERRSSIIFCIFPSQLIALSNDATSLSIRPAGVDAVTLRWDKVSYDRNLSPERQAASIAYFNMYMGEDRDMVERVQRGLKSRRMERCQLGPENLMGVVSDFHRYISRQIV